jgi:hypothetical protein
LNALMAALVPKGATAKPDLLGKRPLDDLFGSALGGALLRLPMEATPKFGGLDLHGPQAHAKNVGQSAVLRAPLALQSRTVLPVDPLKAEAPKIPTPVAQTPVSEKVFVGAKEGLSRPVSPALVENIVLGTQPEPSVKDRTIKNSDRFTSNGKLPQQGLLKPSTSLVRELPSHQFQFNPVTATEAALVPQAEPMPTTTVTSAAELPVMGKDVQQQIVLPPVRSGRDGVVRVEIDSQLAVEVSQSEDGVEVLLEGAAKAVEQLRGVGTELRNALEAGGFSLASFNTSERNDADHEGVSNRDNHSGKEAVSELKTAIFGRGATLQIVA